MAVTISLPTRSSTRLTSAMMSVLPRRCLNLVWLALPGVVRGRAGDGRRVEAQLGVDVLLLALMLCSVASATRSPAF
jgi:hypothetical protein